MAENALSSYTLLPVRLPAPSPATHWLYARPHQPSAPDRATPRSLFVVNVPPDSTAEHVRHLLGEQLGLGAGRVAAVRFEDAATAAGAATPAAAAPPAPSKDEQAAARPRKRKRREEEEAALADEAAAAAGAVGGAFPPAWDRAMRRSGTNAVVEFVDRESMRAALDAMAAARRGKRSAWPAWGSGLRAQVPALGLERYAAHHRMTYPPKQDLLDAANAHMAAFAEREAARARVDARRRGGADADGFVTVTRGGRAGAARKEEAEAVLARQKERHKGFDNFYRFQARDRMKERAGELVRRFEEDREKIKAMREQRGKFRPE